MKLTDEQVTRIRTAGLTDNHFARLWRLSNDTIRHARIGRRYKHVLTPPDTVPRDPTGGNTLRNFHAKPARVRSTYFGEL